MSLACCQLENTSAESRKRVYVTRRIPEVGIQLLKQQGHKVLIWDNSEIIPQNQLLKYVRGIDGILCMMTDNINQEVLDTAGGNLKIISTMSKSYKHINTEECMKRKIMVANTNVNADCVSEFTVALLLLVAKRFVEGVAAVKKGEWGKWKPMWLCGIELKNRTVGIFGLGRIGCGVAKRLHGFDVARILYNDIVKSPQADMLNVDFVEFEELLKHSDIICICCKLTPETKYIFNKEVFEKMKNTAILINTAKGTIINQSDLYEALVKGEIASAGLDVTDPEPLPLDHKLYSLDNCVITPNLANNAWSMRNEMAEVAAKNIIDLFNGKKPIGEICLS